MSGANQGTAEKYHFVADIVNNYPGHSRTNMCVFRSKPTTELPFTVRLLERHPYSSQAFMPMTHGQTRGYLVIVCLSKEDGSPDIDTMKAFIASSTQGINYRQNTWHHPMVALDGVTDFACLVHENGVPDDDCQITTVEEEVIVQLPGFHEIRIPSKIQFNPLFFVPRIIYTFFLLLCIKKYTAPKNNKKQLCMAVIEEICQGKRTFIAVVQSIYANLPIQDHVETKPPPQQQQQEQQPNADEDGDVFFDSVDYEPEEYNVSSRDNGRCWCTLLTLSLVAFTEGSHRVQTKGQPTLCKGRI